MADFTPSLGITWRQPTFLLPLFCLCTLLGTTQSLAEALATAVLVAIITVAASVVRYLLARWLSSWCSSLAWLVCCATLITALQLLLHAWHYALYRQLGLFLPLTVLAALLLGRDEMPMAGLRGHLRRALRMSGGYALAALVLGSGRELVGHGSLFSDATLLLGPETIHLQQQFFRVDRGFLLAILAPGAFVGLGLGVALYNWLWLRLMQRQSSASP